ncbi:MAG TPA: UDP-glucose 4-epimerase GalE [Pyrinomonadaceae bacterium]|nr:UDP-glucose 4-epimerase GalE [Pyrinomonadaceae bacterium]
MAILVTGGAGYIGSVTVAALLARGEQPLVIDNLVYGHREAVPTGVPLYEGDIGDGELIGRIAAEHDITACMHFSAYAYVGESVEHPKKYFHNNVIQTVRLLDKLIELGILNFVFSSTCATYGEPQYTPIDEDHPQDPTNPYGWSKLMVEQVLRAYDTAYGLRFVALRYFNACGATPELGEDHDPETHLIPLILAAAAGERESVSIFGDDYPTADGTAVRDYIHVSDLADAHILAHDHLKNGGESDVFNLGNGSGYSVKEVVDAARCVTGREIIANVAPRRAGDPSKLVANAAKARENLGWQPQIPSLEAIIESAWAWHSAKPGGYRSS